MIPERTTPIATVRTPDGVEHHPRTQAELDELQQRGARPAGPGWTPRRNRTEMRRLGKRARAERGRNRRQHARDAEVTAVSADQAPPWARIIDENGRPIAPPVRPSAKVAALRAACDRAAHDAPADPPRRRTRRERLAALRSDLPGSTRADLAREDVLRKRLMARALRKRLAARAED